LEIEKLAPTAAPGFRYVSNFWGISGTGAGGGVGAGGGGTGDGEGVEGGNDGVVGVGVGVGEGAGLGASVGTGCGEVGTVAFVDPGSVGDGVGVGVGAGAGAGVRLGCSWQPTDINSSNKTTRDIIHITIRFLILKTTLNQIKERQQLHYVLTVTSTPNHHYTSATLLFSGSFLETK